MTYILQDITPQHILSISTIPPSPILLLLQLSFPLLKKKKGSGSVVQFSLEPMNPGDLSASAFSPNCFSNID